MSWKNFCKAASWTWGTLIPLIVIGGDEAVGAGEGDGGGAGIDRPSPVVALTAASSGSGVGR
jgi:hypothetical protein